MGFFRNFVRNLTRPETLVAAGVSTAVGGPIGGYSYMTTFAIHAGTTAALSTAAQELAPKPKLPDLSSFNIESVGRTQMVKQAIAARRLVYGEVRLSGVIGHIESTEDDKFLHLVIMLASHEVNAINSIYINDELVTLDGSGNVNSGTYKDKVRIKKHLGATDQSADSALVSESSVWTNSHKLQGIAYIYARLEFDRDVFTNGIPNISAIVQGKKVYDPRTSTTVYSTNPALIVRDYLTDAKYGFGATTAEINDTTFTTAANICDEDITLAAGGTEDRYTLNGTIDTGKMPKTILEDMLTSFSGILSYENGKFGVKAGKYVTPTVTIDDDDLRGPISVQTRKSKRDNYNAVKGIFAPPSTNYIPTDYPAYTSDTFLTEDGGNQSFLDYDLPYTTTSATAQRLSKIALFRNRQQITISLFCNLNAFQFSVGDTLNVTNTRLGFSSKAFEVLEWTLVFDAGAFGVDLTLREIASTVYDWSAEEVDFQSDNTVLPNLFDLPVPTLTVSDKLQSFNETAITVLTATLTSSSIYAFDFEVQAKRSVDTDYITLGKASSGTYELFDVEDNAVYDVRGRIISKYGNRSAFATLQHQVVGKTAPPADVTDFSVNIVGTEAHLSWTPVADLDLSHYRIRHSSLTSGAVYADAIDIATKISRPANTATVPAMTGTYFIKAVDKLGNRSQTATSSVAIVEEIKGLNVVATSTQHTAFSGAKNNTAVIDNKLQLDTSTQFDDITGNFDDQVGVFDAAGGNIASSGTYDFDQVVDLGAVYTSRITSNIVLDRLDYVAEFDAATGNFDDREGLFDGDANEFDTTNVEFLVSTTEDDPAGSPTYTPYRKFVVGDYKARGLRFRVKLTSQSGQETPRITNLSVTVDMPDRVTSGADIASGTSGSGKAVTFSPAFKDVQAVAISASNLQSGDYYAITNKTGTGFTITFYNSSDAVVDRTFDYVAKGYGELAA